MAAIRRVVDERVKAGIECREPSLPGGMKARRNVATHSDFGTGPGVLDGSDLDVKRRQRRGRGTRKQSTTPPFTTTPSSTDLNSSDSSVGTEPDEEHAPKKCSFYDIFDNRVDVGTQTPMANDGEDAYDLWLVKAHYAGLLNTIDDRMRAHENKLKDKDDLLQGLEDRLKSQEDLLRAHEDKVKDKDNLLQELEDKLKSQEDLMRAQENKLKVQEQAQVQEQQGEQVQKVQPAQLLQQLRRNREGGEQSQEQEQTQGGKAQETEEAKGQRGQGRQGRGRERASSRRAVTELETVCRKSQKDQEGEEGKKGGEKKSEAGRVIRKEQEQKQRSKEGTTGVGQGICYEHSFSFQALQSEEQEQEQDPEPVAAEDAQDQEPESEVQWLKQIVEKRKSKPGIAEVTAKEMHGYFVDIGFSWEEFRRDLSAADPEKGLKTAVWTLQDFFEKEKDKRQ